MQVCVLGNMLTDKKELEFWTPQFEHVLDVQ